MNSEHMEGQVTSQQNLKLVTTAVASLCLEQSRVMAVFACCCVARGKKERKKTNGLIAQKHRTKKRNTLTKKKPHSHKKKMHRSRSGVSKNKGNKTSRSTKSQIPEASELAIQNLLLNLNILRSEYFAHFDKDTKLFGELGSVLRTRIQSRVYNLCRPEIEGKRRYKLNSTDPTQISPPPPPPTSPASTPLSSPAPPSPPSRSPSPPPSPSPSPPPSRSQHTQNYHPTEKGNMDPNELPTKELPVKELNLDEKVRLDCDVLTFYAEKTMTHDGTSVTKVILQKPLHDMNDYLIHGYYRATLGVEESTGMVNTIKIRRPIVPGAMIADAKARNTDEAKTKEAGVFMATCDPLYQNQAALENEMKRSPKENTVVDVYRVKSDLFKDITLNNKYFNPYATRDREDYLLDVKIEVVQNPFMDIDECGTETEHIQYCMKVFWEFYIEASEMQVEGIHKKSSRPISIAKGTRISHAGECEASHDSSRRSDPPSSEPMDTGEDDRIPEEVESQSQEQILAREAQEAREAREAQEAQEAQEAREAQEAQEAQEANEEIERQALERERLQEDIERIDRQLRHEVECLERQDREDRRRIEIKDAKDVKSKRNAESERRRRRRRQLKNMIVLRKASATPTVPSVDPTPPSIMSSAAVPTQQQQQQQTGLLQNAKRHHERFKADDERKLSAPSPRKEGKIRRVMNRFSIDTSISSDLLSTPLGIKTTGLDTSLSVPMKALSADDADLPPSPLDEPVKADSPGSFSLFDDLEDQLGGLNIVDQPIVQPTTTTTTTTTDVEEQRRTEDQRRIAEEQRIAIAEQRRIAEVQPRTEDQRRIAEEQRIAIAEQRRIAEEQRIAIAEQRRIAEVQRTALPPPVRSPTFSMGSNDDREDHFERSGGKATTTVTTPDERIEAFRAQRKGHLQTGVRLDKRLNQQQNNSRAKRSTKVATRRVQGDMLVEVQTTTSQGDLEEQRQRWNNGKPVAFDGAVVATRTSTAAATSNQTVRRTRSQSRQARGRSQTPRENFTLSDQMKNIAKISKEEVLMQQGGEEKEEMEIEEQKEEDE